MSAESIMSTSEIILDRSDAGSSSVEQSSVSNAGGVLMPSSSQNGPLPSLAEPVMTSIEAPAGSRKTKSRRSRARESVTKEGRSSLPASLEAGKDGVTKGLERLMSTLDDSGEESTQAESPRMIPADEFFLQTRSDSTGAPPHGPYSETGGDPPISITPLKNILASTGLEYLYYWIDGGGELCSPGKCWYGKKHMGKHMFEIYTQLSLEEMTTLPSKINIGTFSISLKHGMTITEFLSVNQLLPNSLSFLPLIAYGFHKTTSNWRYYCMHSDKYYNFNSKTYIQTVGSPYFYRMDSEVLLKMRNNSKNPEVIKNIEAILDARFYTYTKLQLLPEEKEERPKTLYDKLKDYFFSFCSGIPTFMSKSATFVTELFEGAWSAVKRIVGDAVYEYIDHCTAGLKYLMVAALVYVMAAYVGCRVVEMFIQGAAHFFDKSLKLLLPSSGYRDEASVVDVVTMVITGAILTFSFVLNIGISNLAKKAVALSQMLSFGSKIPSLSKILVGLFSEHGFGVMMSIFKDSEAETAFLTEKIQTYFMERVTNPGLHLTHVYLARNEELLKAAKGNLKLVHQFEKLMDDNVKLNANRNVVNGLTPYHIWIFGAPGTGKSTLADEINKLEAANAEIIGLPIKKSMDDYQPMYNVSNGDKYYSGYKGENMLYDDAGSMVDATAEKYFNDILSLVSGNPHFLNQASLNDPSLGIKGTICSATMVIATSNLYKASSSINKILNKPDAVFRRRHMTLEVKVKEEFSKYYISGKNMDFKTIKKEHPQFEERDFEHLNFYIRDLTTDNSQGPYVFKEIRTMLLEVWTNHWTGVNDMMAMKQNLQGYDLSSWGVYQDQAGAGEYLAWSGLVLRNIFFMNAWKKGKVVCDNPIIVEKMKGLRQTTYAELTQYYSIYHFDSDQIEPTIPVRCRNSELIYGMEEVTGSNLSYRLHLNNLLILDSIKLYEKIKVSGGLRKPNDKIKARLEGAVHSDVETLRNLLRVYEERSFFPRFASSGTDFTRVHTFDDCLYLDYRDETFEQQISFGKTKEPVVREATKISWKDWFFDKLASLSKFVKEHKIFFAAFFIGIAALAVLGSNTKVSELTLDYIDQGRKAKRSYQGRKRVQTGPSGGSDDTDANGRKLFGRRFAKRLVAWNPDRDTREEVERRVAQLGGAWSDYADTAGDASGKPMTEIEVASLMLGEMTVSQGKTMIRSNYIMPLGRWIVFPLHYLAGFGFDTEGEYSVTIYMPKDVDRLRPIVFNLQMSDIVLFQETKSDGETIECDVVAFNLPSNLAQAVRDRRSFFVTENEIPNVGYNGNCISMFSKVGNKVYQRLGSDLEYCVDIEKESINPDDPTWTRTRGFYSSMKTAVGDCGSLVSYNFSNTSCKFVGMHTGSFGHGTIAKSCVVSREMLDELHKMSSAIPISCYEDQAAVYEIPSELKSAPGGIVLGDNLPVVGHLGKQEQSYLPMVNDMKKSICYGKEGAPWGYPTKFPSNLSRATPLSTRMHEDGTSIAIDPVANNLKKVVYGKPLRPATVKVVSKWLRDEIIDLGVKAGSRGRILSEHEAINGIEGVYESLDLNTAVGPLLDKSKDKKLPGKHSFIGGEIGNRKVTSPDLRAAIDELLALSKKGVRQEIKKSTVADYPKQEKVGIDKILGFKTLAEEPKNPQVRLFQIGNVHYLLLFRRYFGAFQMFFESIRGKFRHAIGLDPLSGEVPKILEGLKGLKPLDGDYEAFDKVASGEFHEPIVDIINEWYKKFDPGCTDEDCLVRKILYDYISRCFHQIEGNIYLQTNGIPSGFLFTAIANCMLNWLLLAYCFKRLIPDSVKADWDRVFKMFMGDDNQLGIPPEFNNDFNGRTISNVLKEHGINYTPAAKGEAEFNLDKNLEDCEFIKHNFMFLKDGNIVLKPQLASINNGLQYCNITTRNNPHLNVPLFHEVLLKTFLHGEEVYNNYHKHLTEVLKNQKISGTLPEFEEAYQIMLQRYGGVTNFMELRPKPKRVAFSRKY